MAIGLSNESEYLGVDAMAGRRITAIANHLIFSNRKKHEKTIC